MPIPKAARTNPSVPHGIAGRRGVVARVSGGGRELETIAVDAEVYMTAQVPWGTEPVGAAEIGCGFTHAALRRRHRTICRWQLSGTLPWADLGERHRRGAACRSRSCARSAISIDTDDSTVFVTETHEALFTLGSTLSRPR